MKRLINKLLIPNTNPRPTYFWLAGGATACAFALSWGGYTRLTHSGEIKSTVEWLSLLPPREESEWQNAFQQFQKSPAFEQEHDMTLDEFKRKFYIHYIQSTAGKLTAVYFVAPLLFLWKSFQFGMKLRVFSLFGIMGFQGWTAVKMLQSHVDENVQQEGRKRISTYWLSLHNFGGLTLFGTFFWQFLNAYQAKVFTTDLKIGRLRAIAYLTAAGVLGTMYLGSLVAGCEAGRINTNWPFMGESYFLPENAFDLEPAYRNFVENPALVQFNHRIAAYITYLTSLNGFLLVRSLPVDRYLKFLIKGNFHFANLQLICGIYSLYQASEIWPSLLHQGTGLAWLAFSLYCCYYLRIPLK